MRKKCVQDFCKKIRSKYHIIVHTGGYRDPYIPKEVLHCISLALLPNSRCIKSIYIPFTTRVFLNKVYKEVDLKIANSNLAKIFSHYLIWEKQR